MEKNREGGNKTQNKPDQKKGLVQEHEPKAADQQGRRDQQTQPLPRRERRDQDSPQQHEQTPVPASERSDEETIGRPVQLTPEPK